ncbi:MAG: thymidine phosphorylase [Vampirovibrionia bacterium]
MARYVDLIYKKRFGKEHTKEEIQQIVDGVSSGEMPDYQISAWLMAICINGMSIDETAYLTEAMVKSGDVIDLSSLGEYVIDKHSTGGVGDKTTLVLTPLLASAGLPIAKLSGRGLGHTGGTIDKLEAIPNFNTSVPTDEFLNQIKEIGIAIGGQTAKLAPADKTLYALRDVTATVDSIPLIAASVVSKKVASGSNVIILDVKYGTGAFMSTVDDAISLSKTMVEVGDRLGKHITCVVTSMEQPLGQAVGHSLEVIESIETLKHNGPEDLTELCLTLGAVALTKSKIVKDIEEGKKLLVSNLDNGKALKKFEDLVKAQGGDLSVFTDYSQFKQAKIKHEYKSTKSGYVASCDALSVARGCKALGAGRDKKDEPINMAVGVVVKKKVSDAVSAGDVLAEIYADSEDKLKQTIEYLDNAYTIVDQPVEKPVLISKMLGA